MEIFFGLENLFSGNIFEWMDNIVATKINRKKKSQFDLMREVAEDVEFEEIIVNENREQEPIKMLE